MATAQLTSLLLSDIPRSESGQASGIQSSIRQLGSALGVALLGGLLFSRLTTVTSGNLTSLHLPGAVVSSITTAVRDSAGLAIAGLQARPGGQAVAHAATDAMISASSVTLWVAAAALALGLTLTLALPRSGSGGGR